MFRCSRACLLLIRPKSEPAQTAWFSSALSLWILSATVTFRALLLWAGPGHQDLPSCPSSTIPSASLQRSQGRTPPKFISRIAKQLKGLYPSPCQAFLTLMGVIYSFLHPQNSQTTSFKPKPCKGSVFLSLQKSTFGGQLHSRNGAAPLKQPCASVSPPVARLSNSRVEFVFSTKNIFLGVFWFLRGFFIDLIQAKKERESGEKM